MDANHRVVTEGDICRIGMDEPPEVKEFIDACIRPGSQDVPVDAIGRALQGFRWPVGFELSSIFAWSRLLNRLDEYLTYVTESNIKTLLDPDMTIKAELPVADREVVAALDCLQEVLRHVVGREHFRSLPQLCDLLASSNPIIVNKTLLLLLTVYERNVSGYQNVPADLANRLQTIAVPQCGPCLLDVAKRDVSSAKAKDGAHFKFSVEPNPVEHVDERTAEEKQFGSSEPKVVKFRSRSELPKNDFEALKSIMDSDGPVRGRRQRFRLLRSIRAAAVYDLSEEELELEACNRLLAAAALVPVGVLGEVYGRVQDTFRKLGADELLQEIFMADSSLTDGIILSGLKAFTAKFIGSERNSYKVDGLDKLLQDGKYSPLGQFLELRCSRSHIDTELRMNIAQETISMVNSICNMAYPCDMLLEANVLECLVPFIADVDPSVRGICERSLTTVELLFTNSTSGVSRLDECNGFQVVESRLRSEITAALSSSVLGYDRKHLIKKLLRALTRIVMTSDTSGINEEKVTVLYWAIKEVFVSYDRFGFGVFDAATSCFRQVLHYEPLQYKPMSSLGLDVAYLEAVSNMKGRDSSVSLNIIPTLSAICLSAAGRELVKSKAALHLIADTFTDVKALCLLPASQAIGRALEEMTRHHEAMLGDVVEMLVSAVDIVRKVGCTGEISVDLSGSFVKDLPNFISIAIFRLTELLIPVCEANRAAAKAFLDQGGLQMFLDLAQPKLSVECFSCTEAGHSVSSLLRSLILLEEQREYALEVTLSNLRASLGDVNRLFTEIELRDGYSDRFCISAWKQEEFKPSFEELIPAISKSTILMSGFAFRRAGATEHKGHALFIDASLCVLPDLERSISRVIRLLSISDSWRIRKDMENVPDEAEKGRQNEIELRRDVLNLFFRSTCTFYNNIGRLGDNARLVWSEQNGYTALDHKNAQEVIGLLSANAAIGVLADLVRRHNGGPELERQTIRACRIVTAILFDQRKKTLFSCSLNAFIRYGGLDLLLSLVTRVGAKCLDTSGATSPFAPTVKVIKEQERGLEVTGIGRAPLKKDGSPSEWEQQSTIVSTQHAFLSMLGILEIVTAREAYKKDSESCLNPGLYEPPYWAETAADSLQKELVHSVCRHTGACLQKIGFSQSWSTCPLPLAKFLKCLSNCYKEAPEYLVKYSLMDAAPLNAVQIQEQIANDMERETFAKSPNVDVDLDQVVKRFHDLKASIIMDAYCRTGMIERLQFRQENRMAATLPTGDKRRSLRIWDEKAKEGKSFSFDTFSLVMSRSRQKGNMKPAKMMIERSTAAAHVLLSVNRILASGDDPSSLASMSRLLTSSSDLNSRNASRAPLNELLSLVQTHPWSAHDIADMLVEYYGQDDATCASLVTDFGVQISESIARMGSLSSSELEKWALEGKDDVLGPVMHLLAAVLNVSSIYRTRFSHGLLSNVLKLLDCWKLGCIAVKKSKAGNSLRVPKWVDASLLCLALLCEEKFKPDKHAIEKDSSPNSDLLPMENFLSKIRNMLPPVQDGRDVANFSAASSHAIDCLKMSLKYADHGWMPLSKEDAESSGHFYEPCPRSSVLASLELLVTTSKVRKAADAILSNRGHNLVLSLSEPLHTTECDKMVAKILRHLVEDDEALQSSMEATIRSGMQRSRRGPHAADPNGFKTLSVKQFVASFLHLACRNSSVFSKAVESTCEFSKEGSTVRVDCKPAPASSPSGPTPGSRVPVSAHTDVSGAPGSHVVEIGALTDADPPPSKPEERSALKGGHRSQKSSPKKSNKKGVPPASTVMDAIIGRLLQASTPAFLQKMTDACKKHSVDGAPAFDPKLSAELFCLCQQSLCINVLSTLLASFPACLTAFLRRDADPLLDWVAAKPSWKSPHKASLHTPQTKGVGDQEMKSRPSHKRASKSREHKAPHSAPNAGHSGPTSVSKPKSPVTEVRFLIHSIIRNQISYHGSSRNFPMRQALGKDACSLLITLSQRSKEGRVRVCRELGCILRSFAYYPSLKISGCGEDPSLHGSAARSLENKDTRSISADLEGSLVLLATMLSVSIPGHALSQVASYQKEMVESLLSSGFVEVLVDVITCIDLSDGGTDRTKVCLSAIIRSLEKLTSVRATDKNNEDQGENGELQHFEELIAHLNDRGWHLAGDHETDSELADEHMDAELHSSESNLSESPSYFSGNPSYLSDTSYSSLSDHDGEFDIGLGESGDDSDGIDDDHGSEGFSSDPFSSSSGLISGSMGDESDDSDEDMMDPADNSSDSDQDDHDVLRDYELDYQPDLDDIFPPEETDFDRAEFDDHDAAHWGRHESNDFNRVHRDLIFDGTGDSEDEEGFLDGNDHSEEYYSDEEYEEDNPSSPFGDDRLVDGHALANTPVPPFWIQENGPDRGTHWRESDPLFGTAFISPRLLSSHIGGIGLLRRSRGSESRIPASPHSHPLITRFQGGPNALPPRHSSSGVEDPAERYGRFRWAPPPMPLPSFQGMAPLLVGFRAHPLGDPRVYGTRIPERVVESFASALDESMGGRPSGTNRRRDRFDQRSTDWVPGVNDRATSPNFARPRQRQRTDQDQEGGLGGHNQNSNDHIIAVDRMADPVAPRTSLPFGPDHVAEAPRPEHASAGSEDDLEPIDPEFLAALPPDLQREVLENRERELRARRIARQDRRRIEIMVPHYMEEAPPSGSSEETPGDGGDVADGEQAGDTVADPSAVSGVNINVGNVVTRSDPPVPGNGAEGQGQGHAERRGEMHPAPPSRASLPRLGFAGPSSRPIQDVGDLQDMLREEGILPADRGFIQDLQMLRARANDFGSRFFPADARPFDPNLTTEDLHQGSFQSRSRGRRGPRDPRDLRIMHPFRETSERLVDVQSDRKPLLQENQIPQLIKLLRFSRWEGRLHLNRAIRHLTEAKATGAQVFQQIFALLRCPLSSVEANADNLSEALGSLKHPMPSLLADLHGYVVASHGSCTVVTALGLEPQDDESDGERGIIATSVVRRLLELLRHCFNLVKRGVGVILTLDEVGPLYSLYKGLKLIESNPVPSTADEHSIPALDVLLSLPLRHGVSKGNLRGVSLELVVKFLTHFEKTEMDIRDIDQRIKDKRVRAKKENKDAQFPSITRLEVEKLEMERDALEEKAAPVRVFFKKLNPAIIRNYVMMLTYPSLRDSEIESVRMILQSLALMNIEHWETLCIAAAEFVHVLSAEVRADLHDLASGHVAKKIWKPDTKGMGVFRCLQVVAEGVFQLVVDRFDPSVPSLPDVAQTAREIAARALSEMLDLTRKNLWEPFNEAATAIERDLRKEDVSNKATLPLPVQLIRPYVESYFLLHDTLRCSTCSLDVLSREISELTEEEEAWTNKREEIARAAEEQATTSFTRIQSIDFGALPKTTETPGSEKKDNHAPCMPSSDTDFMRFAENHRTLVNLIASHDGSVLEESMNMLLKHPKLLDFENKRVYFRKRVQGLARQLSHHTRLSLNIRRPHAFEDSFNQLRVVSKSQLRSPLKVTFTGEEGVDAGGVSREWYQVMSREMFNPAISLFEAVPQGSSTYQPNPNSIVQTDDARGISHLDYFKFVGHVVGKALLDDQVIDAHFTRSFYKHMLGQPLTYKDIEGVDPDFFKNLTWMLNNSIDGVLELTFSEENDFFGQKSIIELCPNGANVKVTDENKGDYVDAIARHRMTSAIQPQIHAFLEGFWNVLPRVSLQLFSDHELELMISGLPDIDVLDLRANCEYHGGYTATSQVVLWFWEILIAMDREQRALLLQFVTGTSKVPVGGFGELQAISGRQKFQIHKAYGGTDRLPTAHTCFNQLDLPPYNTKDQLKERLLLAIHEGKEGFGFA